MPDEKDFAGTCRICKKPAYYKQGVQLNESNQIEHDECEERESEGEDEV